MDEFKIKMMNTETYFKIDNPINAMAINRDGTQVALAGRGLLKVYSLSSENSLLGTEVHNLISSNMKNLNFSNSDVAWCPTEDGILATAATNGAVVVWNMFNTTKSKVEVIFNDHKRTVNKVCFHYSDSNILLSGSQDGCMKLFDLRKKDAITTFVSNSESVRDVQFCPYPSWINQFVSVQETGNVEIWDLRRIDKPECNFIAHDGPVFACEWHPNLDNSNKWLATGGRDKTIKVWDLNNRTKPNVVHSVHTIAPVAKLKWQPGKEFHIGSCSLVVDFSVYVWDIKRPYVPFAIFGTRKDVTTGLAWHPDSNHFISSCKDGTVYQHSFENDAFYPAEHYRPIGMDFNCAGDIAFSITDFIKRYSHTVNPNAYVNPTSPSTRLVKTNSLGTNHNLPSSVGISIPTNNNQNLNNHHSFAVSTSLTQNFQLDFPSNISINDVKNRLVAMSNQYLSNATQPIAVESQTHVPIPLPLIPPEPFSISVPISYRKTDESVLVEHFRCMVSYMMLFLSKEMESLEENIRSDLSMGYFLYSAQNYNLSERSFEELCEKNAGVADTLRRHQVAQTWRIVRHMFSISGRHPNSSGGAGNNPSGGSIPNIPPEVIPGAADYKLKHDNPSRHTSGGTRHFSGNNNPPLGANNGNKDSSEDEDMQEIYDVSQPFPTLKHKNTIPSNKFAVDFFDYNSSNLDSEISESLSIQTRDDSNLYEFESNHQDWELQRESIFHRHNITECNIQMNDLNVNPSVENSLTMGNYDASSPVSFDEDDDPGPNQIDTPGLFDKNLQSLLSSKNQVPVVWPFTELVADMLRYYVDHGDVQTAVSIIAVLGDKMKHVTSIDKRTIQIWFRAYIELLHCFKLWNVSTRLIQMSSDSEIQGLNQSLTTFLVYCARCNKPIKHGSVHCEKCRTEPSSCSICNVSVRGLYTWCQGCAHGGHLQHMIEWFKSNSLCPAGCGHHCELC